MRRQVVAVCCLLMLASCAPRRQRRGATAPQLPAPASSSATSEAPSSPPAIIVPPASDVCLPLGEAYAPLLAILQTPTPGPPPGFLETIGPFAYVSDLSGWRALYPEGSVAREAVLRHEAVHAIRQGVVGVVAWCDRYGSDPSFRLAEEEAGYAEQLGVIVSAGAPIDVDSFVAAMTNPFYRGMIAPDAARAWVLETTGALR